MTRKIKTINIEVGARIRAAREQQKLSRDYLSERAGITNRFLSDAERGTVGLSLTTLCNICAILGVSTDEILLGESPEVDNAVLQIKNMLHGVDERYYPMLVESLRQNISMIHLAESDEES